MKKILAYRFSAFGDVGMIVPVLKEFLAQNPDTEIVFVSRKNFADLFDGVERLTFRGVNLDDYKGVFGLRKLTKELNKEYNPKYKFPHSMASTLLEMAHSQKFFMQNLPALTDFAKEQDDKKIILFLESMLFSSIANNR